MTPQYGFLFNADRCVMCHSCETACKSARGIPPGLSWRKVVEIWQGRYPCVGRTFVSLSCLHCADPPCQKACPTGAISKRDQDGIVVVDKERCNGCRECLSSCPFGVPQFGPDGTMQKCDFCLERGRETACTACCPTDALVSGDMERLAGPATEKGGRRLTGAEGPSLFVLNRRGQQASASSLQDWHLQLGVTKHRT